MDERQARILCNLHPRMGPARFRDLLERYGSARTALEQVRHWPDPRDGGKPVLWKADFDALHPAREREETLLKKLGARALIADDEEYPEAFRRLRDAPPVLYILGSLKPVDALGVAVVGTRHPSAYGRAAAERLSRELASAGVTVVSGLARGVDTAAHGACLKAGGRTVGILGSGFNDFYPKENKALALRMADRGAVLTEFPLDAPPDATHFPRRNRLIAALSLGVVVVEARERSGALITANLAAEQGRDVFAVPGSIFSADSAGPHLLLKNGARPATSAVDVLDAISVFRNLIEKGLSAASALKKGCFDDMKRQPFPEGMPEISRRVLEALSLDPLTADALAERLSLSAAAVAAVLLTLEVDGWVRALPGQNYVRTELSMRSN